ncbi:UPF0223 family protein [Companilactobacillus sp.]|jgi:uncharacterized protein YktA (UPF0223 family)|uniref:UPF0223 family protein n=1 Tax=Companilactobacillus sp. TaxID=2767905 RepID=UPI0025BB8444|nr:UPF0223 family protein [Companilactobacillus sp.]MCH4008403.1 UPF0223 family protein [Companilactobacillus sp.]MCH4051418.1 UPF0223 family protein [Companilactobacillus sp.]MCH4076346.1 UPF0223 family protein [Companilactobacillus sp.]MCH4124921.1 UPF0223 family protein [Companilactobacillus sp.]MCH4131463.1 UPF0223 family protein [Companilactobacillus sp.]
MRDNYSYPLDEEWSNSDIVGVMALYNAVEKAYESGIKREDFLQKYREFCQIVPMKMEQRRLDKEFQVESGYSIYQVFKQCQSTPSNGKVRLHYEGKKSRNR